MPGHILLHLKISADCLYKINNFFFRNNFQKKDKPFLNSVHELGVVYFAQKKVVIPKIYGAENHSKII